MALTIKEADLDRDKTTIVAALKNYLTPRSDGKRFQWLYKENPFGLARTWIATEVDGGAVIGVASAFPRRVYSGLHEVSGWVLGDFCIASEFRTLGPALQLQRHLWQELQSEATPFFYDFPSASMMAVFRRLNIFQTGQCIRYVKLLRVDQKIKAVVKSPVLATLLSLAGNIMLQTVIGKSARSSRYVLALYEQPCGEEFSDLTHEIGSRYGVCVQRTAQYLNWRYLENPLEKHEILTARIDGKLEGFVVFTQAGEDAQMVDLVACDVERLHEILIGGCVELLRRRGVGTIHVPVLSGHPWIGALVSQGFRSRESVPFVASVVSRYRSQLAPECGTVWALMHGDRDS